LQSRTCKHTKKKNKKKREQKKKKKTNGRSTKAQDHLTCYSVFAGMLGAALPPGAMHPAFATPMGFPGAPMLAPMMHPRFR
jgi:hypothetical protein